MDEGFRGMTFDEKKLNASKIITVFSDRMKWGVFSKSIKNNDFPTAMNYEKLIGKIENLTNSTEGNIAIDVICNLTDKLKEHAISGEKSVRLARVLPEYIEAFNIYVLGVLDGLDFQDGQWLFEREPSLGVEETPEVVHSMAMDRGLVWVFNSTRETTSKEEIPSSAVSSDYKVNCAQSEKFFVIKKIIQRCHDVIFYDPESGVIEFRIDNPLGFSTNERTEAFHMLEVAFRAHCMERLGQQINFKTYELFPTIDALYQMPAGDGRVVELSFTTDEGGIKNSKKRFNDGCILEEEFHKSGCAGINDQLTPYKIARVWPFKSAMFNSEPELMLPGSLRMVSQSTAGGLILGEFLVTKSVGHNDFKMITDKLRNIMGIDQGNDGQSITS
jgi:hypothetical protein